MDQTVVVPIGLFIMIVVLAIGVPLVRAFARNLDRRNSPLALSSDIENRLQQLQQSVDSVAVEVERISEAQRFTTRLLAERGVENGSDDDVSVRSSAARSRHGRR